MKQGYEERSGLCRIFDGHRNQCKHFTGTMNTRCEAGIKYKDHRLPLSKTIDIKHSIPCWGREEQPCPKYTRLTDKEWQGHCEESDRAVREMIERIENGQCVVCDQAIQSKEQVGPCVYAKPCGHRQYQGTIQEDA